MLARPFAGVSDRPHDPFPYPMSPVGDARLDHAEIEPILLDLGGSSADLYLQPRKAGDVDQPYGSIGMISDALPLVVPRT
jgi:hypothetical protein